MIIQRHAERMMSSLAAHKSKKGIGKLKGISCACRSGLLKPGDLIKTPQKKDVTSFLGKFKHDGG